MSGHIDHTDNGKIIGVHTYNGSEHWEIVDFSQMREVKRNIRMKRMILHISDFFQPFKFNLGL